MRHGSKAKLSVNESRKMVIKRVWVFCVFCLLLGRCVCIRHKLGHERGEEEWTRGECVSQQQLKKQEMCVYEQHMNVCENDPLWLYINLCVCV